MESEIRAPLSLVLGGGTGERDKSTSSAWKSSVSRICAMKTSALKSGTARTVMVKRGEGNSVPALSFTPHVSLSLLHFASHDDGRSKSTVFTKRWSL